MHFSLLIALLMASVGSLLDASPSPITNTPSTKVLKRDDDPAYSGNYAIKACGDRVSLVKTLLESTYESLVQAMDLLPTPVGNGGGSIVYNAFFNGVDPALVKSLYQHMTAGTNVTINRRPFNPTVVCVNDQDPRLVMRKASAACASTSEGTTMGLALRGSPYVFLCPLWTQVHLFPLPYMCGTVGRLNTLTSPVNLATTQYGNLVHVLAHLYLGNSLSPKVMLPNDCIALPPSQSVINPQSYAFYAACEYFWFRELYTNQAN